MYLKNDFDETKLRFSYNGKKSLSSLNRKGSVIGHVVVTYDSKIIDEFDVKLEEVIVFSLDKYLANYKYFILAFVFVVCIGFVSITVYKRIKAQL